MGDGSGKERKGKEREIPTRHLTRSIKGKKNPSYISPRLVGVTSSFYTPKKEGKPAHYFRVKFPHKHFVVCKCNLLPRCDVMARTTSFTVFCVPHTLLAVMIVVINISYFSE